ncbi:MAG: membrane protein insertase YidC [Nitrospira sp.]|nr:membrane protein insertase YidC [Nitrospira sp.]
MEKNTLLAVILSLFVLIGWSFLTQKDTVPQNTRPVEEAPLKQEQTAAAVQGQPLVQQGIEPVAAIPASNGDDIVVETDLYKAIFSTRGAIIKYWELKNFNPDGTPVVLLKESGTIPALGIILDGLDRNLPQNLIYRASTNKLLLSEGGKKDGELIFEYNNSGTVIRKKLVFHNDMYKVDLLIDTVNTPPYLLAIGTDFGVTNKEQREHKGPVLLANDDREEFDEGLDATENFTGHISWIAQEDKYFAAAIIPVTPVEGVTVWKEMNSAEIALKLAPQKNEFIFYAGPKEYDRLKSFNVGFEHIIDFGWFAIVAMPLFWVLKFFYSFLGNYGWSIVLLTIVTRIPFIPIMHKSQKSMKKMQTIQPMMAEIKEKYKNDAQKQQKEMMGLYKKHKVNPIGGCLPMFLQIPVFIALYNVLLNAIELRGAPFVLWVTDLAVKDPYYVLPIVMGATMVLQQKMTPSAMDPKQAKMMMMMPVVFTFMFLSFPAGLVVYWLVNNVLGIAQQHWANTRPEKAEAKS